MANDANKGSNSRNVTKKTSATASGATRGGRASAAPLATDLISLFQSMEPAELQNAIHAATQVSLQKKVVSVRKAVKAFAGFAREFGLTETELIEAIQKNQEAKASAPRNTVLYINPKNQAETWTGFGRAPKWLVEFEKNGGSRDAVKHISKPA